MSIAIKKSIQYMRRKWYIDFVLLYSQAVCKMPALVYIQASYLLLASKTVKGCINMNVLQYVNSKDIREYLGETNYQFSALEAAWLIYQSRNTTLEERHHAWKQLISEYPDCPIEERINTVPQGSLHRFLADYMDMENRMLDRFRDPTGVVYQLEYHYHEDGLDPTSEARVLSEFDPEKIDLALTKEDDIKSIWCQRLPIDGSTEDALGSCFFVKLNPDLRIMEIDPDTSLMEERDKELLQDVFQGLWFDFPTPFQKGDILWDPERADGLWGGPFVCASINLQGIADEKRMEYMRRNADNTDMTAHGVFTCKGEGVYWECMHNYMNCEYYRKELTGHKLLLKPFSEYEKGDASAELLLHACRYIMLELEKEDSGVKYYTAETLKKVGIG